MDENQSGWPPRDALPHIPAHTPIQAPRQADGVSPATFMQHQTAWRFTQPFGLPTQNTGIFTPPAWPTSGDWPQPASAAKLTGEWTDLPRPLALVMTSLPTAEKERETETNMETEEHVEVEERASEGTHHSASYDVSASQSPDDPTQRENSEEHIDVEASTSPSAEDRTETLVIDEQPTIVPPPIVAPTPLEVPPPPAPAKEDEATRLLLSFSQSSFPNAGDETSVSTTTEKPMEFTPSSLSAFSEPTTTQPEVSSSFCRPPGLGPVTTPTNGQNSVLVCPICGFSSNSKFHYNSHMNTHGDHKCLICDYTSRTEGRLKKHMRDSHTIEEQLKAGLEVEPPSTSTPNPTDTSALSSTMATIVDVANAVAAGNTEAAATSLASLGLDTGDSLLNSISTTSLPTALEKMREFAEKSSQLLPDSSVNLVTALGAMSQFQHDDSPEKNSEPRRNSNGKIKQFKCKQCPHVSFTKNDQWDHHRTHIPVEKQMNCKLCNFVTEYKHHLEYHIRNHNGQKPFQCKKCTYQCVNKSMLNSHMKSHTNVYQYRCMDCTYATKYCHSLKLHLKKYDHRRVPEGIDVADSSPSQIVKSEPLNGFHLGQFARPPAPATTLAQTLGLSSPITSQSLNYASQMLLRQHQMEQMNLMGLNTLAGLPTTQLKCTICDYQTASQEDLMRHSVTHIMASTASPIVSLYQSLPQMSSLLPNMPNLAKSEPMESTSEHHESDGHSGDDEMDGSSGSTASPSSFKGVSDDDAQKRKGCKVDQIGERLLGKSPSSDSSAAEKDHEEPIPASSSVSPTDSSMVPVAPLATSMAAFANLHDPALNIFQKASCIAQLTSALQGKQESWRFQCHHCRMAFQEQALYQIHMGYHGYDHVFKCNRCGFFAGDSLNFNLHLLQASHE